MSPELRELLLRGPVGHPPTQTTMLRYGGAAHVRAQWHRHRQQLLDACPPGRRPWGLWAIERRSRSGRSRSSGRYGHGSSTGMTLRGALVHRRLDEIITHARRAVKDAARAVA